MTAKVALGYVLIISIMAVAVWLVGGNSRVLTQASEAERMYVCRRSLMDSLVYCYMQAGNAERSICMNVDKWDSFDRHVSAAISIADSLDRVTDGRLTGRIDSLKMYFAMMRANTKAVMRIMARYEPGAALDKKVRSLREGGDSVLIVADSTQRREETRVTVEVVRNRKGFFRRLADAFRKQRDDTVKVGRETTVHADTAVQTVDIAGDVAQALAEVQSQEELQMRDIDAKLRNSVWRQQRAGMATAARIQQLISRLREEEYITRQASFDADLRGRRELLAHIVALSVISVVAAAVLLCLVRRDNRRAERYRRGLQRAKEETERLMLTITHDIKAPAASVSGFIDLMRDELASTGNDNGRIAEYLSNIKATADHLLRLVRTLLDHRQMQEGAMVLHPVAFNAGRLIVECAEGMRPMVCQRGLTLHCVVDESCNAVCRADALRLRQILENLIGNAVKYTAEGGITVTACMSDGILAVSMADTGVGMTEEETERIFEAFARLDGACGIEGTGLGLSITKELVSQLNGTINVRSVKGEGTVFKVEIPVEIVTGNVEETDDDDVNATVAVNVRDIMVVDDDPLQRRLVCELLSRMVASDGSAPRVMEVPSAERALELLRVSRPDAMLVDVEMPGMGGEQLAAAVRAGGVGVYMVAMTAHDTAIKPRLSAAGFSECLFKPVGRDGLRRVLGLRDKGADDAPDTGCDLSALTAFADGDREAQDEIMRCFREQMEELVAILDEGMGRCDRERISYVAHKAAPTLTMIGFSEEEALLSLSPERIGRLADDGVLRQAEVLRAGIKAVLRQV